MILVEERTQTDPNLKQTVEKNSTMSRIFQVTTSLTNNVHIKRSKYSNYTK